MRKAAFPEGKKGRPLWGLSVCVRTGKEKPQVPFDFAQGRFSTTLRSGRDDNSVAGKWPKSDQTNDC
jgi:hypothetical protein